MGSIFGKYFKVTEYQRTAANHKQEPPRPKKGPDMSKHMTFYNNASKHIGVKLFSLAVTFLLLWYSVPYLFPNTSGVGQFLIAIPLFFIAREIVALPLALGAAFINIVLVKRHLDKGEK